MNRFQKTIVAVLVTIVVVVGVGMGVLVKQQADATAYQNFLTCMELHGSTPTNPGTSDEALAAREACDY